MATKLQYLFTMSPLSKAGDPIITPLTFRKGGLVNCLLSAELGSLPEHWGCKEVKHVRINGNPNVINQLEF